MSAQIEILENDFDKEFRKAVEKGIKQANEGKVIPYEDVRKWLLSWGTENELQAPVIK